MIEIRGNAPEVDGRRSEANYHDARHELLAAFERAFDLAVSFAKRDPRSARAPMMARAALEHARLDRALNELAHVSIRS